MPRNARRRASTALTNATNESNLERANIAARGSGGAAAGPAGAGAAPQQQDLPLSSLQWLLQQDQSPSCQQQEQQQLGPVGLLQLLQVMWRPLQVR